MQKLPQWLENDPDLHPRPPTETLLQELPFGELTWENFERLCLRLARMSADIEDCRLYGTAGQAQGGIDLYARKKLAEKYTVYQCKREEDFGPSKVEAAVRTFLKGNWVERTSLLVLCTKEDLRSTQRTDALESQRAVLKARGIDLSAWDAFELNIRLKDYVQIVDDFFGRAWAEAFCGPEALEALRHRIDGPRATNVRADLRHFYSIVFKKDDPGLPISSLDSQYLPLEDRYVVPDVLPARKIQADLFEKRAQPEKREGQSHSTEKKPASEVVQDRRASHRQPVDEWLKDKRLSVVLAGPGMGKSTLLRFVVLDVLSQNPRLASLSALHKNRLPVWIPFGYWTTLVSNDPAAGQSIEDVVQRWLHHLACDNLWPSIREAMGDERLLLLVDGIDEYRSEAAADVALRQLQIFVESRNCPAILTSRPHGFQRLPTFSGEWSLGNLAEFTAEQRHRFVAVWAQVRFAAPGGVASQPDISNRIRGHVEHFEGELSRTSGIRDLAGIPLLLGVLVYLNNSNLPLPRDRFQAYRLMTDHLIADHPRSRRRAASLTEDPSEFGPDDLRRILAALAFEISTSRPEGVIERPEALKGVRAFLSDIQIGFGYDATAARRSAERVILDGETSLGLIVERAPGLCSFVHRAFQEHLCASHMASLTADEQLREIKTRIADPQWREIILAVANLASRPNDVRAIVEQVKSVEVDTLARFGIETILCEIATGPFQCPPDLSIELCQRFADEVEVGPWMLHRMALLRLLLGGMHSPKVRQVVSKRLRTWYPCQNAWRRELFAVLVGNGDDATECDALFRGLHAEDANSRDSAIAVIAGLRPLKPELSDRLIGLLAQPNQVPVVAAASEALMLGWPDHRIWDDLEDRLRRSASIALRLIAIRRRIRTGRQNDDDRHELIWLASRNGPFLWRPGVEVVSSLVEGWPGDVEIRNLAIRCLNPRAQRNDGIASEAAARILIDGYTQDVIATAALCQLIRTEEHAFLSDHHAIWKSLSEKYVGDPQMIAAADEWLEKWSAHRYPEISYASRLGWTPTAKKKLIEISTSWVPFWAADALVEGWGTADAEVAQALTALAESDKAANIAHLFPRLFPDQPDCFARLLAMFEAEDCRDPARVFTGICAVANDEERERVLPIALKWAERSQVMGYREGLVHVLLQNFREDSRVLAFARREMKRRDGCWFDVLKTFRDDPECLAEGYRMATPLPVELRSEIVTFLEENALMDREAFDLLESYDLEADPNLKTRAAIAYCKALAATDRPKDSAIDALSQALVSGGPDFESRRQAAVCGLDTLESLDLVVTIRRARQDPLPVSVTDGGQPNDAFIVYLLSHWSRLRTAMGDDFNRTFFQNGNPNDLNWWSHVAGVADDYPEVRDALLTMLTEVRNAQLYSELLLFLGRNRPRSALLLEHCLRVIRDEGQKTGRWIEIDTAAFLLGRDFAGDKEVLSAILESVNKTRFWDTGNALWAACEGWPDAELVVQAYEVLKARSRGENVIQIASIVDMHLLCCRGTPEEVIGGVTAFISRLYDNLQYHASAFLRPLLKRIKEDRELQSLLHARLITPANQSEACSIAAILNRAVGLDADLRRWAADNTMQTHKEESLCSPAGFDLGAGTVRTTWEVGMDLLQGAS